MKVSMKVILGVFSVSTVACAPKVTTTPPAVNVGPSSAPDSKSFDRHLTSRMREAFAEQDVPETFAKSADDVKFLTRGGPPSQVTLEGALVKSPTEADARISIGLKYGTGRDGLAPRGVRAQPNLFLRQSDASRAALAALGNRQTYVRIGCVFGGPEDVDGLTKIDVTPAPITRIEAKVVQICKGAMTNFYSLHIVADRIVISELDLSLTGLAARQVSLVAREIVLLQSNTLRTKGTNDELTYAPGPSVLMSAEKISGDGSLAIQATGSNFVSKY